MLLLRGAWHTQEWWIKPTSTSKIIMVYLFVATFLSEKKTRKAHVSQIMFDGLRSYVCVLAVDPFKKSAFKASWWRNSGKNNAIFSLNICEKGSENVSQWGSELWIRIVHKIPIYLHNELHNIGCYVWKQMHMLPIYLVRASYVFNCDHPCLFSVTLQIIWY